MKWDFAREVADRVLFLDDGQLVEDAPPAEFFSSPKSKRAQDFLEKDFVGDINSVKNQ